MDTRDIRRDLAETPFEDLRARADAVRAATKGPGVRLRAIIEFSNHCVRNCLYCGLRRANTRLVRSRLAPGEMIELAARAAGQGLGTVVLQSGDDLEYPAATLAHVIRAIKGRAEVTITLSVGERPAADYELWREAGAERFLMKHETADPELYDRLHPGKRLSERLAALKTLKALGYEIGTGFIVGLPGQTADILARDVALTAELGADMCGVGPFVPQADTPLANVPPGPVEPTLRALAATRLACPECNLPATTALATLDPEHGQTMALRAGANVIMPCFTPEHFRDDYRIYDNKSAVSVHAARAAIRAAGRELVVDGRLKTPCATRRRA